MHTLYHYPICPFSRTVRFVLEEKKIQYKINTELFWERRSRFLAINPTGTIPVLVGKHGSVIWSSYAICEYLEETYQDNNSLIYGNPDMKGQIRKIISWMESSFYEDATRCILQEKVYNYAQNKATKPNIENLKIAKNNLNKHLQYINYLLEKHNKIICHTLSLADCVVASHLSSLDYLSEIDWERYPIIKEWYMVIKSRPSFKDILFDIVPGFTPPKHYRELDF